MYKNAKQGWYKVINSNKVMKPQDEHMKSFRINENCVELNYKSSLEYKAIKYADYNKHVIKFSLEPFAIKYIKPTDGKYHRYYIDLFLEFSSGDKLIVEIKSKSETLPPKKPKKTTNKSTRNYQKALMTYSINMAKWTAAREFAEKNKIKFVILTEDQLG
jgi:hypothetical protein